MYLDLFTIVIFVAYVYILFCMIQKEDYTNMVILTLIALILLCYRRKSMMEEFSPENMAYVNGGVQSEDNMERNFVNVINEVVERNPGEIVSTIDVPNNDPGLLYNNVSAWDGLCLQTGNKEFWSHSPNNVPLVNDDTLFTVQGHSTPLKPVISDPTSLTGPPVDGIDGSPTKLFMLSNNVSSPDCCPSTFSTSTGCVCTTDNQRDFVAARGVL